MAVFATGVPFKGSIGVPFEGSKGVPHEGSIRVPFEGSIGVPFKGSIISDPLRVNPRNLEHGFRTINAGISDTLAYGNEDDAVPTFWLLL